MQCPKCRAVIDLAKPAAARAGESLAARPEAAEIAALRKRLEALENRVRALEAPGRQPTADVPFASTPGAATPPPETALAVVPARLRWVAPAAEPAPGDGFAPEAEAALLHNLSAFSDRTIIIGAAAGDVGAHSRAARLRKIFELAQWSVQAPREAAPPGARRGLSLFIGALPASPNASAAYLAFTASGFTLASMINPALTGDEALLFVA